jgi:hypothetical protein
VRPFALQEAKRAAKAARHGNKREKEEAERKAAEAAAAAAAEAEAREREAAAAAKAAKEKEKKAMRNAKAELRKMLAHAKSAREAATSRDSALPHLSPLAAGLTDYEVDLIAGA